MLIIIATMFTIVSHDSTFEYQGLDNSSALFSMLVLMDFISSNVLNSVIIMDNCRFIARRTMIHGLFAGANAPLAQKVFLGRMESNHYTGLQRPMSYH